MLEQSNPPAAPERELGGGDHDQEYCPGHPKLLLSEHELARLLPLRGRVLDGEPH